MTAKPPRSRPPSPLVEFVLQHAVVQTNVCSRQIFEDGYRLPPRTIPDYNLIFVTRGTAVWVVSDEAIELKNGDLVFVPPGVKHHGYSRTQHMSLTSIHVEARLPSGQDVFELLTPPRVQNVAKDSYLDRYLRTATLEFDRPHRVEQIQMLNSWGRLCALELLRDAAQRGTLRYSPLDPLVMQVMEELNRRLGEPTRLEDLAAWAGYTAQHLNRLFQRQIGMTPLQYLTRLRLEYAAEQLLDGRKTVRAIALQVGYDDPYYFSRLFKQHFGRSPNQYREAAGHPPGSDYPS